MTSDIIEFPSANAFEPAWRPYPALEHKIYTVRSVWTFFFVAEAIIAEQDVTDINFPPHYNSAIISSKQITTLKKERERAIKPKPRPIFTSRWEKLLPVSFDKAETKERKISFRKDVCLTRSRQTTITREGRNFHSGVSVVSERVVADAAAFAWLHFHVCLQNVRKLLCAVLMYTYVRTCVYRRLIPALYMCRATVRLLDRFSQ